MSKEQRTPRQKFIRNLTQMLRWQSLPRGSAERATAVATWLAQGQHEGGKPRKPESATEEGQRIKGKRDRWRFSWREKIRGDAELLKMADEAGVLDKPRADALPGDFANPDPRVYKAVPSAAPQVPEGSEQTRVADALRRWRSKKNS